MPIALTNQFVRPTGAHKILSLLLCWPVFGSAIACTTVDIKKRLSGFWVFYCLLRRIYIKVWGPWIIGVLREKPQAIFDESRHIPGFLRRPQEQPDTSYSSVASAFWRTAARLSFWSQWTWQISSGWADLVNGFLSDKVTTNVLSYLGRVANLYRRTL
jgi:hypothetical protein